MKDELPFCQCGCGQRVIRPTARFLRGHWSRLPEYKAKMNTPEAIAKRVIKRKQTIAKNPKAFWDKIHSPKAKQKRVKSLQQFIANLSDDERKAYWDKIYTPETREKMSKAQIQYFANLSDDERQAISKRCSEHAKQMWANRTPEERVEIGEKISKALTGKTIPQEVRDRISATLKGHHYHDSDSDAVRKWRVWATTDEGKDALRRGAFAAAQITSYTSIEVAMYAALDQLGVNYLPQHVLKDKFCVDAYILDIPLIMEAWGTFWHADPRKYDRNDIDSLYDVQRSVVYQDMRKERYFTKIGIPIISIWETELNKDAVKAVKEALSSYIQL